MTVVFTMIEHLTHIAAQRDTRPIIVTFSRKPMRGHLGQIFGAGSAFNVVLDLREGDIVLDKAFLCGKAPDDQQPHPIREIEKMLLGSAAKHRYAVFFRFVDKLSLTTLAERKPELFRHCEAVVLQIKDQQPREEAERALAHLRFDRTASASAGLRSEISILVRDTGNGARGTTNDAMQAWPRMERLIVVDPCLDGRRGHYLPIALNLTAGARDIGVETVWVSNTQFPPAGAPDDVTVLPRFTRSFFDVSADDAATSDLSDGIHAVLRDVLDRFDEPGTHLLAHSADPSVIRAAMRLAAGDLPARAVLHICVPSQPWRMPGRAGGVEVSRALAVLAQSSTWNRSIFLWAETHPLALKLSERLGTRVPVLPLPAPFWVPKQRPPARQCVSLAFIGEGRVDKGFLKLPELAEPLAEIPELRDRFEFVVHLVEPHRGYTPAHLAAIERLARLPFVRFVKGLLATAAYKRLLMSVDAVLLPYSADAYEMRGSGIVVEGISCGRVIVAASGTSIEIIGQDGLVLPFDRTAAFPAIVRRLVHEREALAAEAWRRGELFCHRRRAAGYLQLLQHRAEFAGPSVRADERDPAPQKPRRDVPARSPPVLTADLPAPMRRISKNPQGERDRPPMTRAARA
jgi:glycosyltransferase involved in cell wall biosynthesis